MMCVCDNVLHSTVYVGTNLKYGECAIFNDKKQHGTCSIPLERGSFSESPNLEYIAAYSIASSDFWGRCSEWQDLAVSSDQGNALTLV